MTTQVSTEPATRLPLIPLDLAAADLPAAVTDFVRWELGRLLDLAPELVDLIGEPMTSLGVGSVAGLELQRRLEAALPVRINLPRLLGAQSATVLIDDLVAQLAARRAESAEPVGSAAGR
ncbi:hypothetical protein CFP65_4210 [Kitasatospora sp. MMS16-BH015]|uniref:acyl carrier protein n=1 Tax=Kitasatospora sp. MMS16-BH015 TaxID=2018025 RepID=UPI000CA099BB|nr:acyl carrier protein [Kitasatospora sp. MMS16-BH015]AUG78964.1 hypothetical protein CFP65_4210 [Kitasatospora sp. MMS16-BH015]